MSIGLSRLCQYLISDELNRYTLCCWFSGFPCNIPWSESELHFHCQHGWFIFNMLIFVYHLLHIWGSGSSNISLGQLSRTPELIKEKIFLISLHFGCHLHLAKLFASTGDELLMTIRFVRIITQIQSRDLRITKAIIE